MALAGYILDYGNSSKDAMELPSRTQSTPNRHGDESNLTLASPNANMSSPFSKAGPPTPNKGMMTFPIPVRSSPGNSKSSHQSSVIPVTGSNGNVVSSGSVGGRSLPEANQHPTESHITVSCIRFSRAEEIEVLWIETIKTFADLSNALPFEVSRKSTFCLQVCVSSLLIRIVVDAYFFQKFYTGNSNVRKHCQFSRSPMVQNPV